jgi:DNA-binding LacI/PurR family transcriptional regulator
MFYIPFLKGIEEAVKDEPSLLFVSTAQDSKLKARIEMDQLIAKGVDGLIIASLVVAEDGEDNFSRGSSSLPPIVTVDHPSQSRYAVLLNSESAGYQATSHLVKHGHERIGLISPPTEWASVQECYLGYRRALQEVGLPFNESLHVMTQDFQIKSGFTAAQELVEMRDPPTAVFAVSDTLAIGAIQSFKDRGLEVMRDIAVVGYNDIELASLVDPPLTTVSAPAKQMGIEAMRMLQQLIRGEVVTPNRVILDTDLIIRRSCGCLRDNTIE